MVFGYANKQIVNWFLLLSTSTCNPPGGGEGGTARKIGWGVCSPLPITLTLFMIKICDFTHPIYDWVKTFDVLFVTIVAGTVALNIIYEGLLSIVPSIMVKKVASC